MPIYGHALPRGVNYNTLAITVLKCDNICAKTKACSENGDCKKGNQTTDDFDHLYACVCKNGFVGDGYSCQDINECLSGSFFTFHKNFIKIGHTFCEHSEHNQRCQSV